MHEIFEDVEFVLLTAGRNWICHRVAGSLDIRSQLELVDHEVVFKGTNLSTEDHVQRDIISVFKCTGRSRASEVASVVSVGARVY